MKSKIVLLTMVTAVLVLSSAAQAGLYVWDGSELDGNWDTVANWSTTGTTYTQPNQEFGNEYFNQDCDWVVLINGDTVNRGGGLSPDGMRDGSNTALLTLDNSSTLNVDGTIWIADHGNTRGRIDVLRGSRLTATGQIKVGDDDLSIGTLNIIDGIVDIGSNLIIANRSGSTGYLNISGEALAQSSSKKEMK